MRKADITTILSVVTKSGSLNFLEPSGPVQACNGTALLYISESAEHVDKISRELRPWDVDTGVQRHGNVRPRTSAVKVLS